MREGPDWDKRPYFVRLKILKPDEVLTCEFPITKLQRDDCEMIEMQKRHNRMNPQFEEATKAKLMKDYRRYRRLLGQPSIGPLVPFEDILIVGYGYRLYEESQGEAALFE